MDFVSIANGIKKYQTAPGGTEVSNQVRKLIEVNGAEILKDPERLSAEVRKLALPSAVKGQLDLIFRCSSITEYLFNSGTDLNMVDLNNVIHSVVNTTGLTYNCVIHLVADVFAARGLDFAVEYGPHLTDSGVRDGFYATMPSNVARREALRAEDLVSGFRDKYGDGESGEKDAAYLAEAAEAVKAVNSLCAAGLAEGFYFKGLLYLYGACNTEKDTEKAASCLKVAAERGSAKAANLLGDYYFNAPGIMGRDLTLAHYYYSKPGALPVNRAQQDNLEEIYATGKKSKTAIVLSSLFFLVSLLFVILFHKGILSGSGRLAVGIIMLVLSGGAVAAGFIYNMKKKYNNISGLPAVQFFLWALYALILVLS